MKTKIIPPTPPEVRLTIPVSQEVHDTFTRIAKGSNTAVGRCMGEWLADTLDAAKFMAEKIEQARTAPSLVARELHSYALGMTDMTTDLMETIRQSSRVQKAVGAAPAALKPPPPSSNTGGKVPPLAAKAYKPTRKSK